MKMFLFTLLGVILLAALVATLCVWLARKIGNRTRLIAANIGEGTHETSALNKRADAAIATRHLLVKQGSDVNHIAVNGASDRPMGICPDSPTAAEDLVSVQLLGGVQGTQLMIASEAIAANAEVFTAANGKIQDEPTTAGIFYRVGVARTAAGADGDKVEVEPCVPERLVVIAALGNTNGEIAALTFTAGGATGPECEALRDKCEELADDVRALQAALTSAKVVTIAA
jgi:hypothetical protein